MGGGSCQEEIMSLMAHRGVGRGGGRKVWGEEKSQKGRGERVRREGGGWGGGKELKGEYLGCTGDAGKKS